MKKAFLYALGLHIILALFLISDIRFSFKSAPIKTKSLVIDYVVIGKKTAAPKKSIDKVADKTNKKKKEKEKKKEKTETKAEESVDNAKRNEDKPVEKAKKRLKKQPKKAKKIKPKPRKKIKKKPVKKKVNTRKKKAEVNLKKPKSGKKKSKKKKKASLDDVFEKIDQDQNNSADTESLAPVLTASDIDALRQKIYKCWVVPAGAERAKDMVVDIDMKLSKDGRVLKAEIVDKSRMKRDNLFKIAAESAHRAVLDPDCNPLPLPLSKYDQWKDLTMSFNPKDMF